MSGPPAGPRRDDPVVQVAGVNHFFGEGEVAKQVLFNNTIRLGAGDLVIMTGPSGSGKTTLLTLIGALRSLQDGSLRVLGEELANLPAKRLVEVRRRIGFIFQAHNLFESLTAHQNVRMALQLGSCSPKEARTRASEILDKLGLGHRMDYKPRALSGGQRQRVAIARALVNRPRLILADEPTAALDKSSSQDVVNLMKALTKEEGSTILMVTHDNRILDVADRIVNMVDGHIVSDVPTVETVHICEFLRRCPEFAALTPSELTGVSAKMGREQFPAGTAVIRQGDRGDKFYIIRSGTVEIYRDDPIDGSRLVDTIGEGEYFGEVALMTENTRNATVVARTDVDLYFLTKEEFQAALYVSPSFTEQLLEALSWRRHNVN